MENRFSRPYDEEKRREEEEAKAQFEQYQVKRRFWFSFQKIYPVQYFYNSYLGQRGTFFRDIVFENTVNLGRSMFVYDDK